MSEIRLLSCPLCGEEFDEPNNTSCKQGDTWLWSTECTGCGLMIEDKDKESLIKRVNTRKPIERIIKRFEEKIKQNPEASLREYRAGLYKAIEIASEEGEIK